MGVKSEGESLYPFCVGESAIRNLNAFFVGYVFKFGGRVNRSVKRGYDAIKTYY